MRGKVVRFLATLSQRLDHPRRCGEKVKKLSFARKPMGSPAQMRGKDNDNHHHEQGIRITPADAGKRATHLEKYKNHEDHPRRCGEKPLKNDFHVYVKGSPPQMRGKEVVADTSTPANRITPADAGKRTALSPFRTDAQDHPRRCGEKQKCLIIRLLSVGSPPQMRGKDKKKVSCDRKSRITPADAGKRFTVSQTFTND